MLLFRAMKGDRNCVKINWKLEISIDAFEHALNKSGCIFLLFLSYNNRRACSLLILHAISDIVHRFCYWLELIQINDCKAGNV